MLIPQVSFYCTWTTFYYIYYFLLNFYFLALPVLAVYFLQKGYKSNRSNSLIDVASISKFNDFFIVLLVFLALFLRGPSSSLWFNHMYLFSSLTYFGLFFLGFMKFFFYVYTSNSLDTNASVLDKSIGISVSFLWFYFLYGVNNLFTLVFFVEVLAIITFYVLSSHWPSSNLPEFCKSAGTRSNYSYYYYIHSLLVLFWVTFLTSVLLFLLIFFMYTRLLTLSPTYLFESGLVSSSVILVALVLFLKLGVAPLFSWKPLFFKGATLEFLVFYVAFYYFFLLLFFLIFFYNVLPLLFFNFNSYLLVAYVPLLLYLFISIVDISGLKEFLAFSSILNTQFVVFFYTFLDLMV